VTKKANSFPPNKKKDFAERHIFVDIASLTETGDVTKKPIGS
jgi:hypothetical protein